jgi:hypothetical protein
MVITTVVILFRFGLLALPKISLVRSENFKGNGTLSLNSVILANVE